MEEKDIKIIEEFNYNFLSQTRLKKDMPVTMYITDEIHNVIMKLLDAYRFEKVAKEEVEELLENSISKERIQDKIKKNNLLLMQGVATIDDRINLNGEIFALQELLEE